MKTEITCAIFHHQQQHNMDRHITFADADLANDEVTDMTVSSSVAVIAPDSDSMSLSTSSLGRTRSRTLSRSTSTSSVGHQRLRRIFISCSAASLLKSARASSIDVQAEPLSFMSYVLSDDFEEVMVGRHGTRKATLFLGPFLDAPEDSDWDVTFGTLSSASIGTVASASSVSVVSSPSVRDESAAYSDRFEQQVGLCRSNFVVSAEDSDQQMTRSHIEVSRGKGGMYTRCFYHRKPWELVRDVDIGACDLVILVWLSSSSTTVTPTNTETEERVFVTVKLNPDSPTELSVFEPNDVSVTGNLLSPQHAILIESLWNQKQIWLLCDNPKELDSTLLATLKHVDYYVEIFQDISVLQQRLDDEDLAYELQQKLRTDRSPFQPCSISTTEEFAQWLNNDT